MHNLAEEIGNKSIILGIAVWGKLGNLPARQIGMDSVQKGNYLKEIGERLEEVVILLMRKITLHVKIADKDETREGKPLLLAPAEPGILHISLHNAHKLSMRYSKT
jgi:hypothetical protein